VTTGSTAGLTFTYFSDAAGTIVLITPNAVAASGTYYIKGSTAAGCSDIKPVVVTINPLPIATIAYTGSPYCATGTATVTRTGQAGGTYTAPGAVSIDAVTGDINLAASTPGTYTVTYSFSNGTCSSTTPATITINALPTATIAYTGSPYCATGTATVTQAGQAGGTYTALPAGLSINASTGAINLSASTPSATPYTITYAFGNGTCSNSTTTTVLINALPTIVITNPAAVCAPGTVDITTAAVTTGSTAGLTFTYFTDAAGTIALATPNAVAASGTYYVKGSTAAGCSDIKPVVVTINPKPTVVVTNPAAVCSPATVDITAAAITTGSTAGLTFTYFTDAAGTIVLATPNAVATSGTYYIKGTLATGCSDIKPVVVTINPKPTVVVTNPVPVCAPATVDITAAGVTTGSTAGLTFTYFTDAAGTISLANANAIASAGTYYIKGSTAAGCSDIQPVTVSFNALPIVTIAYTATPYCATGTATATRTGQAGGTYTAPAAVSIDPVTGDINLAASTPGTYTVTYSFSNGTCSSTTPASITINALPTATITYTGSPYCATGTATVTQAGQAGGTYTALPAGLSINASTGAIDLALSTPSATPYTVTYSFTNGTCNNSTTTTVLINALPTIVITNPAAVCAPGNVDITVAAITTGSTAGLTFTYFTDAAGTIALTTPNAVTTSGTYYIKGTLATGCSDIQPVTVTINPKPTVTITNPAPVCSPATVDITAAAVTSGSTAGLTFTYFTDAVGTIVLATPAAITTSGTYYIKGSTAAGCSDIQPVVVTINPKPSVVVANPAPVCPPATVDITTAAVTTGSSAGLTFTYFTDAAGTLPLANANAIAVGGTYYIKGTTAAGCSDIQPVTVSFNALPAATIAYNASPYCNTGVALVSLTGQTGGFFTAPFGVVIDNLTGAIDLGASPAGTYQIDYTSSNGICSGTASASITINALPVATINYPGSPYCASGTATVTQVGQSGGTYSSTAGLVIDPLTGTINLAASTPSATPYTVKYVFGNGTCTNSTTSLVTVKALPVSTIAYTASPYCTNGTAIVTLTGTGGGAFAATPAGLSLDGVTGDINLPASAEGSYTVTYNVTSAACSYNTSATVVIKNPALVINTPAPVCSPSTVDLTVPAVTTGSAAGLTYSYYLDNAGTVPLVNPATVGTGGNYFIRGFNAGTGCSTNLQPVVVNILAKPSVTASSSTNDICKGTPVTLTAVSPGNTIDWPGVGAGSVVTVSPLDSTIYLAVATSPQGCKDTTTVNINVNGFNLTLTANPDPVLAGTNTTLTTSGNFTYNVISWSPDIFFADQTAMFQNIIVKDTSKSFTVIAQSIDGCLDTATLFVQVDPNLKDFFIPNSFSPNGDGTNDIFKVYGSSVKDVSLRVYNQWGQLIFESQNASIGWDGTWNGRPQMVGVYVYVAQVTFYNGIVTKRKGTINLIR
jgi:gliding motility-associated-like protein